MPTTPTAVEKITWVVYPIWTYYRQESSQSIRNNIASGEAQRFLDAFPRLSRTEACFLALVADIIAGEDPLKGPRITPEGAQAPDTQPPNGLT